MSEALFSTAKQVIPGGVNSPVRAFKSVGGTPFFAKRAKGAYLFSSTGQRYIDYVGSWGPMILGHAHPTVLNAVKKAIKNGLSFGIPTEIETALAHKICALVPSIKKIRMVNSGTEAAMSAIRLARAYTKRKKIIKFAGCYHGHADSLLVKAGSGALTLGVPTSPGIPADLARHTIVLNYNNKPQVESIFQQIGDQIAAIIIEPIAGNMNCIPATYPFLRAIKRQCNEYQSLLIFDEVMSGFRVALGGAQSVYRISPDLTILGKVIGGGMPVGALGGRKEIMDYLAPDGPVYQAGTLSGNPVAMAAGLTTLELISAPGFFEKLADKTKKLLHGLTATAAAMHIPFTTNQAGAMFGLFFTKDKKIRSLAQAMHCDQQHFKKFFHGMLAAGVYLAPSPFEAGFISNAHTDKDISATILAAEKAMTTFK